MKRALWFLILILVIVNACSAKKSTAPVTPAQSTLSESGVSSPVGSQPLPVTGNPTQSAAPTKGGEAAPTAAQDVIKPTATTASAAAAPSAVVGEGGLNLRYGPGLNYRVSRVLNPGQVVRLEGRSRDGDWVVARLSDGTAGWVFGAYLQTQADLAALPMLEAAGGPGGGPVGSVTQPASAATASAPATAATPLPRRYSLNMSIQDNQAVVSLARFPANSDITLRLSVSGGGPAMTVATARTDAAGSASVRFAMPQSWPDGTPLTQSALRLTAATADGSFTGGANIIYSASE